MHLARLPGFGVQACEGYTRPGALAARRLGHLGQQPGVHPVGLGAPAARSRAGGAYDWDLPRVGDIGPVQFLDQQPLAGAGRLQDHQAFPARESALKPAHQRKVALETPTPT